MAILEKKKIIRDKEQKIIPNFSDMMKEIKQWTTPKRKFVSTKTSIGDWKIG